MWFYKFLRQSKLKSTHVDMLVILKIYPRYKILLMPRNASVISLNVWQTLDGKVLEIILYLIFLQKKFGKL